MHSGYHLLISRNGHARKGLEGGGHAEPEQSRRSRHDGSPRCSCGQSFAGLLSTLATAALMSSLNFGDANCWVALLHPSTAYSIFLHGQQQQIQFRRPYLSLECG